MPFRRTILKSAFATAALTILPNRVFGANARLNLAFIGCGNRAKSALIPPFKDENIVAMCDPDAVRSAPALQRAAEFGHKSRVFKDYRRMFDELGAQIDAVVVATPDHQHYPAAMYAMHCGKHVYVEKPMTNTVFECRRMRDLAAAKKLICALGNQGHSTEGIRLAMEWYNGGLLGDVGRVECWTPRSGSGPIEGLGEEAVPETLDWDLWLGPAKPRSFNSRLLKAGTARMWWTLGNGPLGDIGCHTMDAPFWILGLGEPESIEPDSTPSNDLNCPKSSTVTYHFPANDKRGPVTLKWHDGGRQPERPEELATDRKLIEEGALFHGSKAVLYAQGMRPESVRIIPESKMQALKDELPPKTLPRVPNHFTNWTDSIKAKVQPSSNFDYGCGLTELVALGALAIRMRRKLTWDGEKTDSAEANRHLVPFMRKEWDFTMGI